MNQVKNQPVLKFVKKFNPTGPNLWWVELVRGFQPILTF